MIYKINDVKSMLSAYMIINIAVTKTSSPAFKNHYKNITGVITFISKYKFFIKVTAMLKINIKVTF